MREERLCPRSSWWNETPKPTPLPRPLPGHEVATGGSSTILVDDAQWCDGASLRFLSYLARRVRQLPVTLVVAARPPQHVVNQDQVATLRAQLLATLRGHPSTQVLHPAPLSKQGVAQLVRDGPFPSAEEEFCVACARATGGNPFLLRELLREVAGTRTRPAAALPLVVEELVPEAVLRAVGSRLARLPPGAATLARALAVLGEAVPLRHAAALAGLEPTEASSLASALADEAILQPGEPLNFAHRLTRAVVLADQPPGDAGDAHLRAAHLLAGEGVPLETLAAHLLAAPPRADPWAVDVLRRVARRELARGAPTPAARLLGRALAEPPGTATRSEVLAELGEAQAKAGSPEALETLRAAVASVGDPSRRSQLCLQLGWALHGHGRHQEAIEVLQAGLADLGEGDQVLARELRASLVSISSLRSPVGGSELAAATAVLEGHGPDHTVRERSALAQLALQGAYGGAAAAEVAQLAVRAWGGGDILGTDGSTGHAWTLLNRALVAVGEYEQAVAIASRVLDDARRSGSALDFATASYCRAVPLHLLGRLAEAEADFEAALEARELGWDLFTGGLQAFWASHLVDRGDLERADGVLQRPAGEGSGTSLEVPFLLTARGRLRLAQGRPEEALTDLLLAGELLAAMAVRTATVVLPWRSEAVRAAILVGEMGRARALVAEEMALADSVGALSVMGQARRTAAMVERGPTAVRLGEEAVALLEQSHAHVERARALVELGAAVGRTGRRVEARRLLGAGIDLSLGFGAWALATRGRDELIRLGDRPRRLAISGPDALTGSERRVAQMAADGLSNRQIAQSLFVTTKAVEWHLANTYRKLQIRRRQQLPEALGPGGPTAEPVPGDGPDRSGPPS